MSQAQNAYDDAGVARLRRFVEEVTGGKIVRMERQVRWRPAWFADVEVDGRTMALHLRGDRAGDVAIFPDLKREADVMDVLYRHGVPVPRIHGYCQDPPCIVMDTLAGTRDVFAATTSDEQRQDIGRSLMRGLGVMHGLPISAFAAIGLEVPETSKDIALIGLRSYMPLYRRTKSRPEPLLEFAMRWFERNYPAHRTRPNFVQFDCGQFLVEDGRMTGFYDFEFSLISDSHSDLATLAMRDSVEPMGRPLPELFRYYEEATGEPIDHDVVQFYVALFSTLGAMQFTGTVGEPKPGDPHAVYLSWDLSLRKGILFALAHLMGITLPEPEPVAEQPGRFDALVLAIADTVRQINGAEPIDKSGQDQALELVDWLDYENRFGDALRASDLADINAYLGTNMASWAEAQRELERHVQGAPPEEEKALFTLLARLEIRRETVFEPSKLGIHSRNVIPIQTR